MNCIERRRHPSVEGLVKPSFWYKQTPARQSG